MVTARAMALEQHNPVSSPRFTALAKGWAQRGSADELYIGRIEEALRRADRAASGKLRRAAQLARDHVLLMLQNYRQLTRVLDFYEHGAVTSAVRRELSAALDSVQAAEWTCAGIGMRLLAANHGRPDRMAERYIAWAATHAAYLMREPKDRPDHKLPSNDSAEVS